MKAELMPVCSVRFLCLLLLIPSIADSVRGAAVGAVSLADPALTGMPWGNGDSFVADVSGDGRYLVMLSSASNLTPDSSIAGILNVYLRDREHGSMILVSRSRYGDQGGSGHSTGARITPDGTHIVFLSRASDLVWNDGNDSEDIFLWDAASRTARLVSVALGGNRSGNGGSSAPVLTPDGRWVAFVSAASDLVIGDENGIPDIFVRDMQEGVTRMASVGAIRVDHSLSGSESPVITADGRYVAFESLARDLVPGVQPTTGAVYLRDLAENRTVWISRDATNQMGTVWGRGYNPVVSEDGRFVVFKSASGGSGGPRPTLFRHDVTAGITEIIANDAVGNDISTGDDSGPAMTADGRFIAFTRLPPNGAFSDVHVWDAEAGTSELVSVNREGTGGGNGSSDTPGISADGRYVTFLSFATDLVEQPVDGASLLYLRDRALGVTTLLSVDSAGVVSGGQDVVASVISADATFVGLDTFDDRLVTGDVNDVSDVFGWNSGGSGLSLLGGADPDLDSATGGGRSWSVPRSMSADGRYVVFSSEAEDLVPGDFNGVSDVFVRDLETGATVLVSVNLEEAGSGNQASANPTISADGGKVAFGSYANDLVSDDGNDREDVFVRDWLAGTTVLASVGTNGMGTTPRVQTQPVISPDGRHVAFRSRSTELVEEPLDYTVNLYVRNLETETTKLITKNLPGTALFVPEFSGAVFPARGDSVIFEVRASWYGFIYRADLAGGTVERIDAPRVEAGGDPGGSYSSGASVSGDGLRVTFVSSNPVLVEGDNNGRQDVFLRDLTIPATWLITVNTNGLGGNGDALESAISDDGQWLAFVSWASDLAPGDANRGALPGGADRDVFLHEIGTGITQLISRSCRHDGSANGPSDNPAISADGRYVVFRSAASDLVPNDANASNDVFLYDRQTGLTTLMSVSATGPFAGNGPSSQPGISADGRVVLFNSWADDLMAADYNATSDVFRVATEPAGQPSSLVAGIEVFLGSGVRIVWRATLGLRYGVQYKEAPSAPDWVELSGAVRIEDDRGSLEDPDPAAAGYRYYRVILKE